MKHTILGVTILVAIFSFSPNETAEAEPLPPPPLTTVEYAQKMVEQEWGTSEWKSFHRLIERESKWKPTAQNPHSTAYGLGQFLNSTWKTVGCTKTSHPETQLECTRKYVKARYKTPTKALNHQIRKNWY